MTDNTDGTAGADNPAPVTPTEQQVTTPPSDTGGRSVEDRIAGLVAEVGRHKQRADKAEADNTALAEKYKTEDEKRLDQLVNERVESEYGPVKQRLERITAELTTKRDKLLEALPEDGRNCYDESAPVEVQVRQIELVASHLSTPNAAPTSIDSGGNPIPPQPEDKTRYSREEYLAVQKLAVSNPNEFDKEWPKYKKALVEGRIEGMSGGVVAMRK